MKEKAMSRNKKTLVWTAVVVTSMLASAVGLAVNRKIAPAIKPVERMSPTAEALISERKPLAVASPQLSPAAGPAQMVRFTVYDEGIRPTVAHASPGLVSIYLDDKSTHTPSLLIADAQHPIGTITRQIGKLRGHSTILLTVGRYTIYEANRRTSAATLLVAP
jgi:hypothetical protein